MFVEVVGSAVLIAIERRRARIVVARFFEVGDPVAVGVEVEVVRRAVAVGVAFALRAFDVVAECVAVAVFTD
jgi:hypothetical protein